MNLLRKDTGGAAYVLVTDEAIRICDGRDILDLIATVMYATDCNRIAIRKESLDDSFFSLASGVAGDVLQKIVNYQCKLAIIGDFSGYGSQSLQALIRECNRGHDVFFVASEEEAARRLSQA